METASSTPEAPRSSSSKTTLFDRSLTLTSMYASYHPFCLQEPSLSFRSSSLCNSPDAAVDTVEEWDGSAHGAP